MRLLLCWPYSARLGLSKATTYRTVRITEATSRVGDDEHLNRLLRQSQNFEEVLGQIRSNLFAEEVSGRYARYVAAIKASFYEMNRGYLNVPFEFSKFVHNSIRGFLGKFDAIFTLNQDLLLELHYNSIELFYPSKWNGFYFPGMKAPANWQAMASQERLDAIWTPYPTAGFRLEERSQPIFKLHGSVNWRSNAGGDLLVMGSDKQVTIREAPVLAWYGDQFRDYLEKPHTKLMVIGYSFLDEHINQTILDAWGRSRFGIFVIDPRAFDVLRRQRPNQIRVPAPLESIPSLGNSTRPLRTTFGDEDPVEHGKVMRFFE